MILDLIENDDRIATSKFQLQLIYPFVHHMKNFWKNHLPRMCIIVISNFFRGKVVYRLMKKRYQELRKINDEYLHLESPLMID